MSSILSDIPQVIAVSLPLNKDLNLAKVKLVPNCLIMPSARSVSQALLLKVLL